MPLGRFEVTFVRLTKQRTQTLASAGPGIRQRLLGCYASVLPQFTRTIRAHVESLQTGFPAVGYFPSIPLLFSYQ